MAKDPKERKIGKRPAKKPDPEWLVYYKKHKGWIQGIIFGIVVIFFLILNNVGKETQTGRYPDGVDSAKVMDLIKPDTTHADSAKQDSVPPM